MPSATIVDKLRIGVGSAGQIVEEAHLTVLKARPDVTVEWMADANLDRAKVTAAMYRTKALAAADVRRALGVPVRQKG